MASTYSPSSYPMTPMQSYYPGGQTSLQGQMPMQGQLPQGQIPQGMLQGPQGQMQQPPTNFRSEYQGVLHGLNCWVNLMYAGLGMASYGRTFFDMSVSVLRTLSKGVVKIMMKIFGFQFLVRMMNWLNGFRGNREFYNELWGGTAPGSSTESKLGQMLLGLRIVLLLG